MELLLSCQSGHIYFEIFCSLYKDSRFYNYTGHNKIVILAPHKMSRGFARRIIPKILSPWYYFCEMSGKSFVVAVRIVTMLELNGKKIYVQSEF